MSKTLIVLSLLPVRSLTPSASKSTHRTMWGWVKVCSSSPATAFHSFAVKSAAPVAALEASLLSATPHTAPLWPTNVPIQSPVSPCLSIGLPSLQADIE
uniref:Putative secreted protein n=1 Tax=Ixodes ricinus TaxID=34613 RepID=A0A6B0UE51_IXORI